MLSRSLVLAFFVLIHARYISAAGGTTFVFPKDTLGAWTFMVYCIIVLITILQAWLALDMCQRERSPEEDFQCRGLFTLLMLFGILSLVAAYTLDGLLWSRETNTITLHSLNFPTMYVMMDFTRALAHIIIYGALLLLLDYRSHLPRVELYHLSEPKRSRFTVLATTFRLTPIILLLIMLVAAVARAGVGSKHYIIQNAPATVSADRALCHLFLASYILNTAVIGVMSNVLWVNQQSWELTEAEEVYLFDKYVLQRIARGISPMLCIRAAYELISEILRNDPHIGPMNLSALNFADIVVAGVSYAFVCKTALGLGIQPKRWYWIFYYV